jgi:hypothetical protein
VHVGDISVEDPGALQLDLVGSEALEETEPLAEEPRDDIRLELVKDAAARGPSLKRKRSCGSASAESISTAGSSPMSARELRDR